MRKRKQKPFQTIALILTITCLAALGSVAQGPILPTAIPPSPCELRAHLWSVPTQAAKGKTLPIDGNPSLSEALPIVYRDCTRIAYESLVDGNWEIYMARGDGSQPNRLTHNASQDETPSLATGCQLIAFSSSQSGGYDIYTMRGDGSDLRRITVDPAADVMPALSPDGTKIAFESYRDGNESEIYTIDISGGSPTRLTNNAIYDGQPCWSPDSQRILFISDQSGENNVWMMNSDGTDLHQVTFLPHAGGPKWSPDGTRLAFACNDLGTGFASLWIANIDGSSPHLVWRASDPQTDAWPSGWSFDSVYILYEETRWAYGGSGWTVESSYLDIIDPQDTSDQRQLVDSGINMAASWALCDTSPPTSQVNPLPAISTFPIEVSWSGSDDCSTQIEFQVQYRVADTGSWTDWQVTPGATWTSETAGAFSWEHPGKVIHFRCRARDAVGHIEPWPGGAGDAYTSLPAQVSGFVGDCRGVPIAGAEISSPSTYLPPSYSGTDGLYLLRAAGEGPPTLRIAADGYRSAELTRPALGDMDEVNYYLTTEPELVQNGGFESGQAAWYASPGTAFVTADYAYGEGLCHFGATLPAETEMPKRWPQLTRIWQTITIPPDMHQPTLSIMYAIGDGDESAMGCLYATINDGYEETTVLTRDEATPWVSMDEGACYPLWQHAYADLSPWSGHTITITLAYDAGWTYSAALLDQVSGAPWLTPYVSEVTPSFVDRGIATSLVISGTNFIQSPSQAVQVSLGPYALQTTFISDTLLEATLPPTLPSGTYDVWVHNPSGHKSALGNAMTIGGAIAIPLILSDAQDN